MTATETAAPTTTVRMFGKCEVPRCRTRLVIEVEAAFDNRAGRVQPTVAGTRAMLDAWAQRAHATCCASVPVGRLVPVLINGCRYSHGGASWSGLKARRVDTIKCTAKCSDATGPECKCECGGERHGESAR